MWKRVMVTNNLVGGSLVFLFEVIFPLDRIFQIHFDSVLSMVSFARLYPAEMENCFF